MEKKDKKWKIGLKSIENSLYYNIDLSFSHVKKQFPTLEKDYDMKTMDNLYDLIKWICAQEYPEDIDFKKELDIEETPLIEFIHKQSSMWWYKYNGDMIDDAKYILSLCKTCKGMGYTDDDEEEECEDCFNGYEENDLHWEAIDEARNNIIKSCNKSSFKELSKILVTI